MARVLLIVAVLGAFGFFTLPNVDVGSWFRDNAPAKAEFVTFTTISDWSEHRDHLAKLFAGELDQVPNYSPMRRSPENPLSPTEQHKKGMVLHATSSLDGGDDGRFRFLTLYLFRDSGMTPIKFVFENGKTLSTKTMLVGGSVDLSTGLITYAYPASGYIWTRPAGPNSIEVEYHVQYRCVTGDGTPNRWKANPDCDQHLFPERIIFIEQGAGES